MSVRRYFTPLPEDPFTVGIPTSLVRVTGDAAADELEALRTWMWSNGRYGGLKRDVWNPSCGSIRRSYGYRARPCRFFRTYVSVRRERKVMPSFPKKAAFYLLPDEYESEKDKRATEGLACFRRGWHSDVCPHALVSVDE
jgi:hypothetical protein